MEFNDVANARRIQFMRNHPEAARNQHIAAPLDQVLVVRTAMKKISIDRAHVVRPLLLNENQRPLPRTKRIMLNAG